MTGAYHLRFLFVQPRPRTAGAGHLAGARKAFEQALAIFAANLPAIHPSIRTVQSNLEVLNRLPAVSNS